MSNKGFLILAQNSEGIDYVQQAYLLALSIARTQSRYKSVSLLTNDPVPEKYKHAFENIIPIPWEDSAEGTVWKVENRWKFIYASPYEETIVLDSDMLFFNDITETWDHLSNYDLFFTSKAYDYKERAITDLKNRRTFIENSLPNIYFALHYFKKTKFAFEFYKTLEMVCRNWKSFYSQITPKATQSWLSMDVSTAITIKILGIEDQVTNPSIDFSFVHMKPNVQQWSPIPYRWTDSADFYMTEDFQLYINQFKQNKIFHYTEHEFLNEQILKILESANV
jgi:hypothetical protein